MIISGVITVIGGTYGCRWRELQPITFGGGPRNGDENDGNGSLEGASVNGEHGDEEMGFSRGRGRGRGSDGGGEYEMVGMNHDSGK